MLDESMVIRANLCLHKAREDYNTAKFNLKKEFYGATNDRAYFCMYHAARALSVLDGLDLRGSCSIMSHFSFEYVHEEAYFDSRFYDMMETALQSRDDSNYNDCHIETRGEALRNTENAGIFLSEMENFVARKVRLFYTPPVVFDPDDED